MSLRRPRPICQLVVGLTRQSSLASLLSVSAITAQDEPPGRRDCRQGDAKRDDDDCNLQPYKAAYFSENKFDSGAPRVRDGVADNLDTALHPRLCARQQLRFLLKSRYYQHPSQNDGDHPK